MEVIITTEVLKVIENYSQALTRYAISTSRAKQKVDNMVSSLYDLGTHPRPLPICSHRDLLQTLDNREIPLNRNLRRFNYEDESGFSWAFSCLYNEEEGTITIMKMIPGRFVVKEDKKTVFSESRLRQIVSEAVGNTLRKRLY